VIRARVTDERGWAVVTAIMVMALMLSLGLAALAQVDSQQKQSGVERVRESSFNLGESALESQVFLLSRTWPASAPGFPQWCASTVAAAGCPSAATLSASLTNADYSSGFSWVTSVRDNGGSSKEFYTPAVDTQACTDAAGAVIGPGPCTWDANGDGEMWVRAQANVGRNSGVVVGVTPVTTGPRNRRTIVTRVKIEQRSVVFPKSVLIAGRFSARGGPKPFVQLNGATLGLRCTSTNIPNGSKTDPCLTTTKAGQIQGPGTVQAPYPSPEHLLSPQQMDDLESTAKASGTYCGPDQANSAFCNAGCPRNPTGKVVFVEGGANCSYTGNRTVNSLAAPGIYVSRDGTLEFSGTVDYYGAIYMYNAQNSTAADVLDLGSSTTLTGAAFIDGNAGFEVHSNTRLIYNPNAVSSVSTFGSAGTIRSSFQEIKGA